MRAVGAHPFWMDARSRVEQLRLRRMPLLAAALCFALGEVFALQWQASVAAPLAFGLLLVLAIAAMRAAPRVAPLPIFALWIVAGCWCVQMQPWPAHHPQTLLYADGLSRIVRGHVLRVRQLPAAPAATDADAALPAWQREPNAWEPEHGDAMTSIDLALEQVEDVTPDTSAMHDATGAVRITVFGDLPALRCGQQLTMPLRLRVPETYRDPGAWSYAAQLESEGIALQASAHAAQIDFGAAERPEWSCRFFAAQTWASARFTRLVRSPATRWLPHAAQLTDNDAAMLSAMLFGDRTQLTQDLRGSFERTGSFHLVVVSGLHVALLAGMLVWLLRRCRLPQWIVVPLTLLLTTTYAALTGFGVPVQRALLMTAVYLLARWMLRDITALQALGAAALAVLIADPRALFTASFQMTFLVLLAITGIAAPIIDGMLGPWLRATRDLDAVWTDMRLHPREAQRRVLLRLFGEAFAGAFGNWARKLPVFLMRLLLRLLELCIASAVVEACMALPMAVYFHRATLFALPSNALLLPLIAVLVPLAVLTFAASLLSSWLAALPAALTALLLHGISFTINRFSHAHLADIRIPAPMMPVLILALGCFAAACWTLRRATRLRLLGGVALLLAMPVIVLWPEPPLLHPHLLEVTAIDVGQGDSLLVVSPDGHTMLVDAGGPVGQAAGTTRWDVGEEVVAPYLWSRRLRRLDVVLLTHAHSDHMGGMPAVLRDMHPRELWLSVEPGNSPDLRTLLAEAAMLGITVRHLRAGMNFVWNGIAASVLAPEADYVNHSVPVNDDSLVLRLDDGKASVLLEGDAEKPSEARMIAEHRVHPVTLLKVGHHGSLTSTNLDFFTAAAPHEAVISVGRRNTFGHPRFEVLQRIEAAHVPGWRTDREGAVTFLLTPDGGISAQSVASNP